MTAAPGGSPFDTGSASAVALGQIQGGRNYQEDTAAWRCRTDPGGGCGLTLLVLADGMGGHAGGAVASDSAVKAALATLEAASDPGGALDQALRAANDAVAEAVSRQPELAGMGCTLVLAVADSSGLRWLSVGDSPMWLWRAGRLTRLNADHSMAAVYADMVRAGRMTAEEAATSPQRSALRSAVMGEHISLVDHRSEPLTLQRGDLVLVASDGLETLAETDIGRILGESAAEAADTEVAVNTLLEAVSAVARRGQDNATALLLRCVGPGYAEPTDQSPMTHPTGMHPTGVDTSAATVAAGERRQSIFGRISQRLREIWN